MKESVEKAIRDYFDNYVIHIDDLKAAENAILDVLDCVYIDFEDELLGGEVMEWYKNKTNESLKEVDITKLSGLELMFLANDITLEHSGRRINSEWAVEKLCDINNELYRRLGQ